MTLTPSTRAASVVLLAVALTFVAGVGALTVRDRSAPAVAESSAIFYGAVHAAN